MAKSIPDVKGRPMVEGDLIIMLQGETDNVMYPVWGGTQGYFKGIIAEVHLSQGMVSIDWENGSTGIYDIKKNIFGPYAPSNASQKAANIGNQKAAPSASSGSTGMTAADKALLDKILGFYMDPKVKSLNPQTGGWDTDSDKEAKEKLAADERRAHLDESELKKLVVTEDVRNDIIALLKQSKYTTLIFDEWGLGTTVEYGKGMSMLFWGGPGTGKTWAANCIAKATGRELLVINAANIQTSEPGGANRNIEQAFTTAREKDNVLFLDECDSLITTRDDVGMILSSEINTLLTQIEKFEGICILATNRIDSLDEALERRLALIIEFPDPDFAARKAIWGVLVPQKMPLGTGVTLDALAEYKLTGGQIKNVLLQAARLAAASEAGKVELVHVAAAVKRIQNTKGLMGTQRQASIGGKRDYKIVKG